MLLYREVEEGGLGLHHVQSKALANLISTFMQTACSKRFQKSVFHSWLYRYHVEEEIDLPNPGYTPYYDQSFFKTIKDVKSNSPLNPIYMTVKQWYKLLRNRNKCDNEGSGQ